jgi:hypothetical protein
MPETSRRFDGLPETEADRRFFDLRGSGYQGWIDQDGYPVHDIEEWKQNVGWYDRWPPK